MARSASSSRKVARAAATGGGRTSRGRTPVGWYATLSLIVILGVASVAFSRYQYQHPTKAVEAHPTQSDHWRAAFAVDTCGTFQPNPPAPNPPPTNNGITTQGDGLIHIDPKSSADTGSKATLGRFLAGYPTLVVSSTELGYPGKPVMQNGDKCGSAPGHVAVKVWTGTSDPTGHLVSGDPKNLRLGNGQLITLAFVAKGTAIAMPPSKSALTASAPSSSAGAGASSGTTGPSTGSTGATHP